MSQNCWNRSSFNNALMRLVFVGSKTSTFLRGNFDASTAQGRSKRRYRQISLNVLSSIGARAISVPSALISVPMTLTYLGQERFGLWMTITSLVAFLGFLDLGLGQGLLNAIAEADGKGERTQARAAVSSAVGLLSSIALFSAALLALMYQFVPWARFFNIATEPARSEAGPTAAVLILCFLASMPLSVVRHVQLGYQEGFRNDLWQSAGALTGLVALSVAVWMKSSLPFLVLVFVGSPLLATALNGVVLFGVTRPWLRPSLAGITRELTLKLASQGLYFTGASICAAVVVSADNLIITQLLGPTSVAQYAVPLRLFLLSSALLNAALLPLWPALTEAHTRRDYDWLKKTLRRMTIWGAFSAGVPCLIFVFCGPLLIRWWVGSQIQPGVGLLAALALWTVVSQIGYVLSTALAALGQLRFRLISTVIMTVLGTGLKIGLVKHYGLAGAPAAMTIAFTILFVLPAWIYLERTLDRMYKGRDSDCNGARKAPDPEIRFLSAAIRHVTSILRRLAATLLRWVPLRWIGRYVHSRICAAQMKGQSLETHFFRNLAQLELLARMVKKHKRGERPLRIAVLGCSTGEELYSVIYMLRQCCPALPIEFTAVDISLKAIKQAQLGVYELAGHESDPRCGSLLVRVSEGLQVRAAYRQNVRWHVGDAGDPELRTKIGPQDFVLANNFLVHMNTTDASSCLEKITALLVPSGRILVAGVDPGVRSETMLRLGFTPERDSLEAVHNGDRLLKIGWPLNYWGLEPLDKRRQNWQFRYGTVFQPNSDASKSQDCDKSDPPCIVE